MSVLNRWWMVMMANGYVAAAHAESWVWLQRVAVTCVGCEALCQTGDLEKPQSQPPEKQHAHTSSHSEHRVQAERFPPE